MTSQEAISLGRLRADLPDRCEIATKAELNGASNVIARSAEFILYESDEPAPVLLDFDRKDIPAELGARLEGVMYFY